MTERPAQDRYAAIADGEDTEIKVKASRFIGRAFAVRDDKAIRAALEGVRKRHHDARHHCYAWRLGPPEVARELSQDDGEPKSTAGPPILGAIWRAGVHDALVVVTRWFGGTKLGSGGLVRAYGESAALALNHAKEIEVLREAAFSLAISYDDLGLVEGLLAKHESKVRSVERDWSEDPRFRIVTSIADLDELAAIIREHCAGRARIDLLGELERP